MTLTLALALPESFLLRMKYLLKMIGFFTWRGLYAKFLFCIENAKMTKTKTYFSPEIHSEEKYVFENAKKYLRRQIKNLAYNK